MGKHILEKSSTPFEKLYIFYYITMKLLLRIALFTVEYQYRPDKDTKHISNYLRHKDHLPHLLVDLPTPPFINLPITNVN